jgi:hypothetical protein
LQSVALGGSALTIASSSTLHAADQGEKSSPQSPSELGVLQQPAVEIPVIEKVDVCVCGAGPAGVSAAIAAARQGAVTRLVDVNGCAGGIWTAGLLCWFQGHKQKTGFINELRTTLLERGVAWDEEKSGFAAEVDEMKLLLEELCQAAGVKMLYHTRVVDGHVENGRLKHAGIENKSGRQAIAADVFIDATGDGDLAARSGCGFDLGIGPEQVMQPMSLIAIATGPPSAEIADCLRGFAEPLGKNPKQVLRAEMEKAGVSPSYANPFMTMIREGLYLLMINHQYGVSGIDAQQVTNATIEARAEIHRLVGALRSLGGRWQDFRLVLTAEHIGVREGRRIHGLATVDKEYLREGRTVPDPVCLGRYPIDVHHLGQHVDFERFTVRPYQIPYRALVAKDIDGLMMAGRCISGDFIAHSSYRVTGDASPMGEAAGLAASICAKDKILPRDLDYGKLAPLLPDEYDSAGS